MKFRAVTLLTFCKFTKPQKFVKEIEADTIDSAVDKVVALYEGFENEKGKPIRSIDVLLGNTTERNEGKTKIYNPPTRFTHSYVAENTECCESTTDSSYKYTVGV